MKISGNRKCPQLISILLWMIVFFSFYSCKEDLEDYNQDVQQLTRVQYYGVSETFPQYNPFNGGVRQSGINIYADTLEYKITNYGRLIPIISFLPAGSKQNWYPSVESNQPFYMNYKAGSHRFFFTYMGWDSNTSVTDANIPLSRLADVSFDLPAEKYHTLYFTDDKAAEGAVAAYRVVKVEDIREKAVQSGKVSVRFIQLSMDAGKVTVKQWMKDGTEKDLQLHLDFGDSTGYLELDTTEAQSGVLLFNIYPEGSTDYTTVGIPTETGHSFDVLLHGFTQVHSRQIVTGSTVDYRPVYKTVTFAQSFDATVRKMY